MYYLSSDTSDVTKGKLYKFTKNDKKLIQEKFTFLTCPNSFIKGAIVCQWVAEGQDLSVLDEDYPGVPSKFEFMSWLQADLELKALFEQAKEQRLISTTEKLYNKINNASNLSEETSSKLLEAMKKLAKATESGDATHKVVVNTRVYVPPIIKKWFGKEELPVANECNNDYQI